MTLIQQIEHWFSHFELINMDLQFEYSNLNYEII